MSATWSKLVRLALLGPSKVCMYKHGEHGEHIKFNHILCDSCKLFPLFSKTKIKQNQNQAK